MQFYKGLLHFIQIFVVLVVLPRVADFVSQLGPADSTLHNLIRFAFAATLGLGTIATAYFSDETQPPEYDDEPQSPKERRRREREAVYYTAMLQAAPYARGAMYLFAFLDGSFNLAEAVRGASANGLFDVETNGGWAYLYMLATILFGVAPTIMALVLSRVSSMVDRIPSGYERPVSRKEFDLLRTVMGNLGLKEYRSSDAAVLLSAANEPENELLLPERTVRRSENIKTNGYHETAERIFAYCETIWQNESRVPGPTEVAQNLEVSKGYAHKVIGDWRLQKESDG